MSQLSMFRIARRATCVAAALSLAAFGAAFAQAPQSAAVMADSVAAAGDSARAIAMLEAALKRNARDAAAWHQLGLLSWNMAKSERRPAFIKDKKTIKLLQTADSALRMATVFAPDSARYWLSLSKFNLGSGVSTVRFSAAGQSKNAMEAAVKTGDSLQLAVAADEVGMATWRRYEPVANRGMNNAGMGVDLSNVKRQYAADYLRSMAPKIKPPTGNADYNNAVELFEQAVRADPTSQRFNRHLYMALAERGRWNEMLAIAQKMSKTYPLDFQAWQAIGLASHRLGDDVTASAAFDSAAALMDDAERERMTRLTRILRPVPPKDKKGKDVQMAAGDARSFNKLEEGPRRGLEAMYWMMSDPLALTNENEFRLEFLSRVVFADFRFTNEDLNLRGADTDRGDIYVRYGPPAEEVTVGASGNLSLNSVTLAWIYNDNLVFFFDLIPGFGTARTMFADKDWVDQVKSAVPVMWDNVPSTKLLDTIPIRIARFRAGGDSVDAVIAASVPVDSLVRGLGMARVPVDVDFRLYDQFVKVRGVESIQSSFAPDSATNPLARSWVRRLGPGINVVRVEALQLDSKRAARAMSRVDPVPDAGFGMSDLLLGNRPSVRDGASLASRWSDVKMEPNAGVYAPRAPVGLLWEIYDLEARTGQAKYRVAITVQRTDRAPLSGLAARLVDGLGRTVGRTTQSRRDNLTLSFDRTTAATPAVVEFLALDLADWPKGQYSLKVEVTDAATNKKTSRQSEFRIR